MATKKQLSTILKTDQTTYDPTTLQKLVADIEALKSEKAVKYDPAAIRVLQEPPEDAITVPPHMPLTDAVEILKATHENRSMKVAITHEFVAFPIEGAAALWWAISKLFNVTKPVERRGFFGERYPPSMFSLVTSDGTRVEVPWGTLNIANLGTVGMSYEVKSGIPYFSINATVRRDQSHLIEALAKLTQEYLTDNSIYKGAALNIAFNPLGSWDPFSAVPTFMHIGALEPIVLTDRTQAVLDSEIFLKINNTQTCLDNDIPLRGGLLITGPFGTGKTLLSQHIAKMSVENGWTFIYVKDPELAVALYGLAEMWQPAVLYIEDIDVITSGERSKTINDLSNMLDGAQTKSQQIITVMTTNNEDRISPVLRRAGRITLARLGLADADSVARMIRVYAPEIVDTTEDQLMQVSQMMAGNKPATISHVVRRARQRQIIRTNGESQAISHEDILWGYESYREHIEFMGAPQEKSPPHPVDVIVDDIVKQVTKSVLANL